MVSTFLNPFAARAGSGTPPLPAAPDGRPLALVFADDFQTFRAWTGRDGIWQTTLGDALQFGDRRTMTAAERGVGPAINPVIVGVDPFVVDRGVLEIAAQPAAADPETADYPYVSGLISTQPSFSQTYGYFEMRAELPEGKGLWPAFWMLPTDESWPPEIDIVESIGDPSHVYMTAHSRFGRTVGVEADIVPNMFHTFAVSWDAQQLIWYIDGGEVGRVATPADMHKPMYLLANLAVGGNWPGAPEGSTPSPAKLTIDYIRAYRFDL